MIRLDCELSLMVSTEEQADAIESALVRGPLMLLTPDDLCGGESFQVAVLDASEQFAAQAEEALG